jgi:ATP-dependent DNA helicase RecG
VCEAICAFANDFPRTGQPGIVVIGQADDGTPTGLPVTDELLRELADLRT